MQSTTDEVVVQFQKALANRIPSSVVWIVPHSWIASIWVLTAVNVLAGVVATAAIYVRLKDKERRFLLKKTERAEGTYWVPHSPLITCILIVISNGLNICILVYVYLNWSRNTTTQLGRTISTLMPFPEWMWTWTSSFGPAYACHLFPLEAVENATSPRIARALRFKPSVINAFCYVTPIVVLIPTIALSTSWPISYTNASARERAMVENGNLSNSSPAEIAAANAQFETPNALYQALWAIWLASFLLASGIYIVYSILLQRILRMQLSTLNQLDKATRIAKQQATNAGTKTDSDTESQKNIGSPLIATNDATFALSGTMSESQVESQGGNSPSPKRPKGTGRTSSYLRRASVFGWTPFNATSSLESELRQYSKLDLLRLNSAIITLEAVIFSIFCALWSGFAALKAVQGLALVARPKLVAVILLCQLIIGTGFATLAAITIYWRGRNVANTRMEGSPTLAQAQPQNWKNMLPNIHVNSPKVQIRIELPRLNRNTTRLSGVTDKSDLDFTCVTPTLPIRHGSPKDTNVSDWQAPDTWNDVRLTSEQGASK